MKNARALLVLSDGTVFEGRSFAKRGRAVGETCFYTGVVGYQEVVTDPAWAGALVVLTHPTIGSYGVNDEDNESPDVHVAGVVLKRYSGYVSNFRATGSFEEFLVKRGVVGIEGVDTRAVTVHLRDHGEMMGTIVPGDVHVKSVVAKLKRTHSPWEIDLVKGLAASPVAKPRKRGFKVVVLNLGVSRSTLDQLAQLRCTVKVVTSDASARSVLAAKPDGVLLAGGPGDPHAIDYAVETVKTLLGRTPILGVGLGHLVLALALGSGVERMKTGHRGVNYPVKRAGGGSEITVQSHSFLVDAARLGPHVEVTHVNVNDGSIEGVRSTRFAAASVQFQPATDEKGQPNRLFTQFTGRRKA